MTKILHVLYLSASSYLLTHFQFPVNYIVMNLSFCLTFDIFLNILFQAYLVGFGATVVFTVSNECAAIMKAPPLKTWQDRLL